MKHTVEGADVLPVLLELAASVVSILVCGTCLNHFKLAEKKQVGETTNMLDIVTSLQVADQVINLKVKYEMCPMRTETAKPLQQGRIRLHRRSF